MTIILAAIADDYTGASDLANTWRKAGLRTVQTIGVPSHIANFADVDAVVVSLKIRSVSADEAVSKALAADAFLRDLGVAHVMYKICSTFDSTDDGNIGQVTDALRGRAGADWSLICPAFPETGRTVYKGHLFVAGQPLNESALRHHPLNPMHDANLVRVLAKQTKHPVHNLDFQTVVQGAAVCREHIETMVKEASCSVVADAILQQDLDILGELGISTPVSTGASGLGAGLARAALRTRIRDDVMPHLEPVGGHSAILVGSCSMRTLEQIAAAEKHLPILRLDPDQLIASERGVEAAVNFARSGLGRSPFLIAASRSPKEVIEIQRRYGAARAGLAIESALADIAAALVDMGVRRLVVAGGETSGAVVDRLGIEGFEVGEELAPGVPVLRTMGRADGDLLMALKSGNFGGTGFFMEAVSRLK